MNCPNCKSEIQEGVKFCPNCGYHFPSIERGKSTFEVKFLKKIFGKKEADRQEPIQSDSAEKKIVLKKDGKWGWGWFIFFGFIGTYINKTYTEFGDSIGILYLFGVGISIPLYFYFRNKLLKEVSFLRLRSFISGLISWILTAFIIALISNIVAPDIYGSISRSITKEFKSISAPVNAFKKEDEMLWSLFVENPSTNSEIKNNLRILEKSISLYKSKDSVVLSAYNNFLSILTDAERKYPNKTKDYPIKSTMATSLIDTYVALSNSIHNKFIAMHKYYNALLENTTNSNLLWSTVLNAQEELESNQAKYLQANKILSDINATLNN